MQYHDLENAVRTNTHHVLNDFLQLARGNAAGVASGIHQLLAVPGGRDWLLEEIGYGDDDARRIWVFQLFRVFMGNAWVRDMQFLWNAVRTSGMTDPAVSRLVQTAESIDCDAAADALPDTVSEESVGGSDDAAREWRHLWFQLFLQCGRIESMLQSDGPDGHRYLTCARAIALIDFAQRPNPLADMPSDGVQLGYGTDAQDMILGISWSSFVRTLDFFRSGMARRAGNEEEARRCKEFVAKADRVFDPDNDEEVAPGIRIVRVHRPGQSAESQPYKPDFRRNTAIGLAREASGLVDDKRYADAWNTFERSNAILRKIVRDGETGELYDLRGVSEDHAEVAELIRTECLRDLGVNAKLMASCASHVRTEDDVKACVNDMVRYGEAFDKARNSPESKGDLEGYYAIAVTYLMDYDQPEDRETCLKYCEAFYRTREESFAKGTRMDKFLHSCWLNVNGFIARGLNNDTISPERVMDILVRASRTAADVGDSEGYRMHAYFMGSLLDIMHQKNASWRSSGQVSLESVFASSSFEICGLAFKHHRWEMLKSHAESLIERLPQLHEPQSVSDAVDAVIFYGSHLYDKDQYDEAVKAFETLAEQIRSRGVNGFKSVTIMEVFRHYASSLLYARRFRDAAAAADETERMIDEIESRGVDDDQHQDRRKFMSMTALERCLVYLDHAKALLFLGAFDGVHAYLRGMERILDVHGNGFPDDLAKGLSQEMQKLRDQCEQLHNHYEGSATSDTTDNWTDAARQASDSSHARDDDADDTDNAVNDDRLRKARSGDLTAQIDVMGDLLDGDPSHLGDIESWCDTILDNPALKAEVDAGDDTVLSTVCMYRGLAERLGRGPEAEKESFVWLVRASYCRNPLAGYAQHVLGESYLFGRGVSPDPDRARRWFTQSWDSLLGLATDMSDPSAITMLYHMARNELFRYPDAVKWYTVGVRKGMRDELLQFDRNHVQGDDHMWDPEKSYPLEEVERCAGVDRERILDILHESGYGDGSDDAPDASDALTSLDGIAASLVQARALFPESQGDSRTNEYRSLLAECEARLGFRFTTDEQEVRRTCRELRRRLDLFAEYDRWANEQSDPQSD